jgi:hypothetical protein
MALRLARPGPVQVRIDRAVAIKTGRSCSRPNTEPRFTGRLRRIATLRRPAHTTRRARAPAHAQPTPGPGVYQLTVRAHLDRNRLSRPAHGFVRVVG